MIDFSFIRLKNNLIDAINIDASLTTKIFYFGQVQLSPKEKYLQYSNVVGGIAFNGNYTVHVCDCKGNELLDITEKVAINQEVINGVNQIAFEVAYINQDFYNREVLLKFNHTVSDAVWYSNLLYITDNNIRQTTRFDYLDYSRPNNYYQSIRLNCFFTNNDQEGSLTEYTNINGGKVTGRVVTTNYKNYKFEKIDNFNFKRLNNLLIHTVIYVDGLRCTNKQVLSSSELSGDTNYWLQEFKLPINENDTFIDTFQIFTNLDVAYFVPFGQNTTSSAGTNIGVYFNKNITLLSGATMRLYKDGVLFGNYDSLNVVGSFIAGFVGAFSNGVYRAELDENSVTTILQETNPFLYWDFEIIDGEYNASEYDNNDYLTN